MATDHKYDITVITVVRNCENTLEKTICSIISQKNVKIQFIVIDGGSKDRTIDIIHKYRNDIDYWVSEADKGIYDAMNKGIAVAVGKYINFMNSGDRFSSDTVCEEIFANTEATNEIDVIYGDFIAIDKESGIQKYVTAKEIRHLPNGMVFCHQSAFVAREVALNFPFDLKYKIVADFNQMLSIYYNKHEFRYYPIPIAIIEIGGVSYSNNKTLIETIKVIRSRRPYSTAVLNKIPYFLLGGLRSVLGVKLIMFMRKIKWKLLASQN